MTVAVVVKVYDGIVLAADSATTMQLQNGGAQIYDEANKIFHLHRNLPIGAVTWGLGNIGDASISTITKDLRRRFMGKDSAHASWELDPETYTIEAVTDRVVEMFYDELYLPHFLLSPGDTCTLGYLIAGYSAGAKQPQVRTIHFESVTSRPTVELAVAEDQTGWLSYAQPEATMRLFTGYDPSLGSTLQEHLDPAAWATAQALLPPLNRYPVQPAMPFGDAISLATFMVDVTIGYSKYLLGPNTVGGQVETAGISRHEGFKWVARKHYYPTSVNPGESRHAY